MKDQNIDALLDKAECIHPNKDPRCDDCPSNLTELQKDVIRIYGSLKKKDSPNKSMKWE